ncbi:MAG: methyltransferase domain-containing protein [Desulfovibrio sp.]|nr:methyltransferase domain-containing protein [Desulfovibrio sp.]
MPQASLNPEEIFIRRIQNSLLQQSIAGWRRRGKTLIEINCGDGRFSRTLWQAGFDVTATEADFNLRTLAASSLAGRTEIYAANELDLPFDHNEFDWAVLHLESTKSSELKEVFQEASRVAAHGVVVTFWNACSPVFLLAGRKLWGKSYSWFSVQAALRALKVGSLTTRTTLLFAWPILRRIWPRLFFSSVKTRLPLGAWATLRLDLSPRSTVTPLMLPTKLRKLNRFEPVLE